MSAAVHRRRRRADAAAARVGGQLAVRPRAGYVLLVLALRRRWRCWSRRGCATRASAPGCRRCATTRTRRAPRRRPVPRQARRDRAVGRADGRGRRVLRAGVPVHRPGASPSARPSRSRRWSARSSAAWARCGARCSARWRCTCWPRSRATCSAQLPGHQHGDLRLVLMLIVMFLPRGIVGLGLSVRALWRRQGARRG